jgi:DNA-binding transcriptional LysR family regulator
MLQMVANGRGVAALQRWRVLEYADKMKVVPVKPGSNGIAKQIPLGPAKATSVPITCGPLWRSHAPPHGLQLRLDCGIEVLSGGVGGL